MRSSTIRLSVAAVTPRAISTSPTPITTGCAKFRWAELFRRSRVTAPRSTRAMAESARRCRAARSERSRDREVGTIYVDPDTGNNAIRFLTPISQSLQISAVVDAASEASDSSLTRQNRSHLWKRLGPISTGGESAGQRCPSASNWQGPPWRFVASLHPSTTPPRAGGGNRPIRSHRVDNRAGCCELPGSISHAVQCAVRDSVARHLYG